MGSCVFQVRAVFNDFLSTYANEKGVPATGKTVEISSKHAHSSLGMEPVLR